MRLRAYQQLFLSYLALIAFLVAALTAGADSLLRTTLMDRAERELLGELGLAVAYYDAVDQAPDAVADLLAARSGHRVTIIAPDGEVIGESAVDQGALERMESHAARPEVRAARAVGRGRAIRPSATVGSGLLYVAVLSERGEVVRIAAQLTEIDAALGRVQRGILGVGAAAMILAVVFSLGFSVAVTRPLRRVTAAARAAAAGDLSVRLRERRRDELGELAAALDTLTSELQRRVTQLEGERAETQALIDSMSEAVLALAPDGTLRRANPAARRIFGRRNTARGTPPETVARRPEYLRLVRRALDGETVPPTELLSGNRALLVTAHPLPDGGAVLVFLDVSELRRLEGVRRDFVANASHELKTPLTAIRGYSETLLDPDLTPELTRRFAEIVRANADRLQHIVDDLLDLSRIESGGWAIRPEPLSIRALAADAWQAQRPDEGGKQVELLLDVPPEADAARADPGAVRQIFTNLLSNACRYTPEGGTVTVHARPLAAAPAEEAGGGWVQIEVRDTGTGIAAPHLDRIFERFYRVDPARSRAEGGTGLGLAIVKHLVEAHGGRVQAESEIGQGTAIRFTLPTSPS